MKMKYSLSLGRVAGIFSGNTLVGMLDTENVAEFVMINEALNKR
jgi:hypothetical protein